ncbi:hypothetical protein [Streptomyces otsuchiensis]|uniref:hypothetical protein n=1 Tax=Streptomyces otsuchiensis TaxID=2681388 RepID=UPI00102F31B9|nr:hypothetical protein [Streptomyces otsuchiensis]
MSTDRNRSGAGSHRSGGTAHRPRSRSRSRSRSGARALARRAVLVTLAALLLTATGGAAHADDEEASAAQRIATALGESPVHVDPVFAPSLPVERQAELTERIEESGLPIHVVLVPLVEGDAWGGSPDTMLEVVRDLLGVGAQDPFIAITTSDSGGTRHLRGFEWPADEHEAASAVRAVNMGGNAYQAPLYDRLEDAVELIVDGEGQARYDELMDELRAGLPPTDEPSAGSGASGGGFPLLTVALVVVPLLAVGVTLVALRRRRGVRYTMPSNVFETARVADEDELRRRAKREVLEFGERLTALDAAPDTPGPDDGPGAGEDGARQPGRRRRGRVGGRAKRSEATPGAGRRAVSVRDALDAYAAAGTVLDRARSTTDLVGVLALLAEGRAALEPGGDAAGRLCFFQPLHGVSDRPVRWRLLGRTSSLSVPACARCARAIADHRPPEVLTVRHDGRDMPYFEVPSEHSLWAASGYGAFGDETLTQRVRRGDFTRTLES